MADEDEPTAEAVAQISRIIQREERRITLAVRAAIGKLPDWIPQPITDKAKRTVAKLLRDGFTCKQVTMMVKAEMADKLVVPGIVLDADAFVLAINELAHIRYACSLGSENGLLLLGGENALRGYKSAVGYKQRDDFQDKHIVQKLFSKHRDEIHSLRDFDKFPELKPYRTNKKYADETFRAWINEIAPGHLKRGAPRKK